METPPGRRYTRAVTRRPGWLAIGMVVAAALGARADTDSVRGWDYLVDKLCRDGVPRERAVRLFRDARMPAFDGLAFSLAPRESPMLYRHLRTYTTAEHARQCLDDHRPAFASAEERYGVPASLVASIIQVESGCGRNTGHARIVPALARLAMAAEPENLERNVARQTLFNPGAVARVSDWTRWRAEALENMFYPELRAAIDVADRLDLDPLEMRGSGSGAFGIPQFLPQSYLWFGVDGDGDGRVSLYDPEDAIPSCAQYLQRYGWHEDLSRADRRRVVWGYNHSDAYIDTVLWLADEVRSPAANEHEKATAERTATKRHSTHHKPQHGGTTTKAKSHAKRRPQH
jgi:peptidoglycan lytic transglycosylase B